MLDHNGRRGNAPISLIGVKLLAACALASLGAAKAQAQTQTTATAEEATLQEVVVTGSRITRRDFTAASPILTVNAQKFEDRSGPEIESGLNQLPQFQAGINNQFGQAGETQPSATTSPGASFLNLRGLGPNRNLVLLDGRRAQPANATLAIDVNSIPAAAIDSVEIITGGASAVYGADAIAGVVNFKLKQNFQGIALDAQYGISGAGDDREPSISALIGTNSANGTGNAMVGISYTRRSAVNEIDRAFYKRQLNDPNYLTGANYPQIPFAGFDCGPSARFVGVAPFNCPSQGAVDALFGPGVVPPGASGFSVNRDGTVFYPLRGANGVSAPRYDGALMPQYKLDGNGALGAQDLQSLLSPPLTRWAVFGSAHTEISNGITAFVQGNFSETQIRTSFHPATAVQFWGASIPHDPAHPTTPELESLLNSRPDPTAPWALQIDLDNPAGRRLGVNTSDTYQLLAGLRGALPVQDWTWEVYGSHGQTNFQSTSSSGFVSTSRWQEWLNLPDYGANGTLSRPSLQTAHCTSGFHGALFHGTQPSADCIAAISAAMKSTSLLTQNVAEANLQGRLFQLPANEVRFALGADYRKEDFSFDPDPLLQVSSVNDAPIGLFPLAPTIGSTSVKEVYGELLVPVVRDLPFVKRFNLELGVRHSDYDTAGGSWTYKTLGDLAFNNWITLRGGYQVAQRAPNIAELFQPGSPVITGMAAGDPCAITTPANWGNNASNPHLAQTQALCAALIHKFDPSLVYDPATYTGIFPFYFPVTVDIDQGNRSLKPEKAQTYTAGAVLQSPWANALLAHATLSIDWYDIHINDAIVVASSEILYEQCFNADGKSNPSLTLTGNPFCSYINREVGTGGNRNAYAPFLNFGALETEGVDVQLDWSMDLTDIWHGAAGSVNLNSTINWLDKYAIQATPGAPFHDYAGTVNGGGSNGDQFRYRTFTTLTYSTRPWSIGLRWVHFPGARDADSVVNPQTTLVGPPSHNEYDLFAHWHVNATFDLRAGVDNLFDIAPETVGRNVSTDPSVRTSGSGTLFDYDQLGRRFYIGVKAQF